MVGWISIHQVPDNTTRHRSRHGQSLTVMQQNPFSRESNMSTASQKQAAALARRIPLNGFNLINSPRLNKGTAFTDHERDIFALHGLLPPHVGSLEQQLERRMQALDNEVTPFNKYAFLRDLQDINETLFYALVVRNVEKLLPLVYTPTVGEGCQRFSEIWRKPRGLFLSYPNN